ncbi:HD domain-containing protein [Amycolatopsis silviterrae]|uniref:Metal-dependent phosphohydrolase n=1 Tax=Amycolatopsis silviterrae TaxID=1656914 RepID=A0ABW5H8E6_9PSEU
MPPDPGHRWHSSLARLGGDHHAGRDAWADLEERYGEPHRRYHDLAHATAVAHDAERLAVDLPVHERAVVVLAAWAHDVVYDAVPGSDEQRSAEWLRRWLTRAGVAAQHIDQAEALVLATAAHEAPEGDFAAAALLDADLATLGATPSEYAAYVDKVRQEYARYPDEAWTTGRIAVLESLLNRPALYLTESARSRWEAAARRNLRAELTRCRSARGDHR